MSLDQALTSGRIADAVTEADDLDGLQAIRAPHCAAVIWRRAPEPGFQAWIDALPPEQLPAARVMLRPHDVRAAVTSLCDSANTPPGAERQRLIDDIAAHAEFFAGLMQVAFLRLRLDVVTTNACRKFHIDAVTARLICTYRGPGTQYAPAEAADDHAAISTVPTGAPIILRGTLWPTRPATSLRHRSPPIEGTGETRLMLVLDPVEGSPQITQTRLH